MKLVAWKGKRELKICMTGPTSADFVLFQFLSEAIEHLVDGENEEAEVIATKLRIPDCSCPTTVVNHVGEIFFKVTEGKRTFVVLYECRSNAIVEDFFFRLNSFVFDEIRSLYDRSGTIRRRYDYFVFAGSPNRNDTRVLWRQLFGGDGDENDYRSFHEKIVSCVEKDEVAIVDREGTVKRYQNVGLVAEKKEEWARRYRECDNQEIDSTLPIAKMKEIVEKKEQEIKKRLLLYHLHLLRLEGYRSEKDLSEKDDLTTIEEEYTRLSDKAKEERATEKREILRKLNRFRLAGVNLMRDFSIADSVEDLDAEYARVRKEVYRTKTYNVL